MIKMVYVDNAIDIALEEIVQADGTVEPSDLKAFKDRLNNLIDTILKNDLEEEDEKSSR